MSSDQAGTRGGKRTCFVVMGFGEKVDFQTGRRLNLDAAYHGMIKPAVEEAGLECVRADEIAPSGIIDMPMYEWLFKADVVIADLSTYNPNAFYELGVRHALRPHATIVIAEEKLNYPFDVNHIVIRRYRHLGDDIGVGDGRRFAAELKQALQFVLEKQANDSPVYEFLPELKPPSLKSGASTAGAQPPRDAAVTPPQAADAQAAQPVDATLAALTQSFEKAVGERQFSDAKDSFAVILGLLEGGRPGGSAASNSNLIQRLVRAATGVEGPGRYNILMQARQLLDSLSPKESTDPETLELLGDTEFALFNERKQVHRLSNARDAYEKRYFLRRHYQVGITLANIITLHAEHRRRRAEMLRDVLTAHQLREEVVDIGEKRLTQIDERYKTEARLINDEGEEAARKRAEALKAKLSVWAAIAEAYYGLGDRDGYEAALAEASLISGSDESLKTVEARVAGLAPILARHAELYSTVEKSEEIEFRPAPARPAPPEDKGPEEEKPPAPAPAAPRTRDLIFFSYSHNDRDKEILEEIKKTLTPLFQDETVQMWDDGHIKPGQDWEKEIKEALARAKGAVLLVSREFLISPFITKEELPVIMKGVEDEGIALMWVAVEKAFIQKSKIAKYQGLNDPRKEPLDSFEGKALNNKIYEICEKIAEVIFPDSV